MSLCVLSFNARSIVNKTDKLEAVLLMYNPDVVIITETWLHADIHDSEIVPATYALLRSDRDGRGGGVAIAIKHGIHFQKEIGIPNHESIWCTLKINDSSVLIGGIYRRPNASVDYLTQLHEFLNTIITDRTKLLLTGDFNLPGINWANFSTSSKEAASCQLLLNTVFSFSLSQLIQQPTRIQGSSSSVLDLALVSQSVNSEISLEEGISDHRMLLIKLYFQGPRLRSNSCNSKTVVKIYNRADDASIVDYFEKLWDGFSTNSSDTVNNLWQKLKYAILYCEEHFIPSKMKRTKRETPWITREIIHLKRKIQRMRKRRDNSAIIRQLSSELRTKLKNARRHF